MGFEIKDGCAAASNHQIHQHEEEQQYWMMTLCLLPSPDGQWPETKKTTLKVSSS
jgi:hypothetical protein